MTQAQVSSHFNLIKKEPRLNGLFQGHGVRIFTSVIYRPIFCRDTLLLHFIAHYFLSDKTIWNSSAFKDNTMLCGGLSPGLHPGYCYSAVSGNQVSQMPHVMGGPKAMSPHIGRGGRGKEGK